jgi:hypothetical protein
LSEICAISTTYPVGEGKTTPFDPILAALQSTCGAMGDDNLN